MNISKPICLLLLVLSFSPFSYAQTTPPASPNVNMLPLQSAQLVAPPYTGTNLSATEVKAKIIYYGQKYRVPPMLIFGIAQQESGWQQFIDEDGHGHGHTKYHFEPQEGKIGVGIMQITVSPDNSDYANLCMSEDHNIDVGVQMLVSKWGSTPVIGDGNGDVGREKLENWYYAVWAYNGWGYPNNPNNKSASPPYTAKATVYQDSVYNYIAHNNICSPSVVGMWVDCAITPPTNAEIGSIITGGLHGCGQPIPNTPTPIHIDANFDGVIDGTDGGGSDTDIWVDGGYSGTQNGTQASPYKTVGSAVTAASATQAVTIHIKPGIYSEKINTSKHIHFVTNGSGTVRIGG